MSGLESWKAAGCPSPLVVNEKDGSVLVFVAGGEFEMGDGREENCPRHRVHVDAFYIGLYCVTNGQYGRFVRETGRRAQAETEWETRAWRRGRYAERKKDHPAVFVSWEDAEAYARWSGLRLPSEAEWEKAVRGSRGLLYPWGDEWDGTRCRHNGNRGEEETSEVYAYGEGVSGYGTYNQSGNVWEWCGDWFGEGYYGAGPTANLNPRGPKGGSYRVLRGSSWRRGDPLSPRGAFRGRGAPGNRGAFVGFRLVRTA